MDGHGSGIDYESQPLERSNYVAAIIHLYRGEISRANTWRQRLDQTTNWAIFATTATLGFAFNPDQSHFSVQFANLVLVLFLFIEARRFRFFDVWRARIRKIETNFFGPILERRLDSPEVHWGELIAGDLNEPHFHLTTMQSVRLRLRKNYLPLFGIVFLAWVIKTVIHPESATGWDEVLARLHIGHLGLWVTLAPLGVFYAWLLWVLIIYRIDPGHRDDWDIGEKVSIIDR